jgi:hypothetical protein
MAIADSMSLIPLRLKPTLRLTPGGYLFDGSNAETYTLNPTGKCIVQALLEGQEPARLWSDLVAVFEVPEQRARRDVRNFLAQLRMHRLLVEETLAAS